MSVQWPIVARWLNRVLASCLPGPVHSALCRDLDEGYQSRCVDDSKRAGKWLRRQLFMTMRPARVRELRKVSACELGGASDIGHGTAVLRAVGQGALDLRYSLRLLRRRPAFALMTAIILTGGLSVSIFTYSFMYTVLHKPLPLPDGDAATRIMVVQDGRSGIPDGDVYDFIKRNAQSFEYVGGYITLPVLLRGGDEPRSSFGTYADPNMFDVAKASPLLGRRLVPADAEPGAAPVVVLSHRVWNTAFGADPDVVDTFIEVNGTRTQVVGVMPEAFGFPVFGHLWFAASDETLSPVAGPQTFVNAYALLRPEVTAERANIEMHELIQRYRSTLIGADVLADAPQSATTRTFEMTQMGDEAPLVYVLMHLASGFILLLACVNAGNMLLARALERSREISIRVAIGAPRSRLVRQMMGEGVVLTLVAATSATLIASQALAIFDARARAAVPEGLAYWWRWGMDARTVLAGCALAGLTMLIVGGLPAWRVVRADTNAALREGPQGGNLATDRLSRTLVVVQIAAISVLLFLGGLTGYIAQRAGNIDLGVSTENVLIGSVSIDRDTHSTPEMRLAVLDRLVASMAGDGAVDNVMVRAQIGGGDQRLSIDGVQYEDAGAQPDAYVRTHMGDLDVIGLQVLSGRRFDARDGLGGAPTAIVSETLARDLWPDASPLGKRVRVGSVEDAGSNGEPWRTVVGVVSDVMEGNPLSRNRRTDTLYVPMRQLGPSFAGITFRHRGDSRPAIAAFYDALAEVGPTVEAQRIMDFDEMLGQMQGMSSAASKALVGCFGFALLLAIGGIYGLTARSVTQRTQEIGIRRALGASNARIVQLFLRGGGRQLAVGLGMASAVAGVGTFAVSRFMALDLAVLLTAGLGVPTLISSFVLLATYVPTRRAVQMSPRMAIWRE